jgi:hypothetical protein
MAGRDSLVVPDRGEAIGLGRVKILRNPEFGFDFEMPLLSFLAIKREDGRGHIATCIHLKIDGYGVSEEDAINDMVGSITFFLRENFKCQDKDSAWDNILGRFKSNPRSNVLWDIYHELQIRLAKRNVPTNWDSSWQTETALSKDQVRELEKNSVAVEYKYERAA